MRFIIVNAEGRRVCDEDIHVTSVIDAIQEHVGYHPECPKVGFCLGVLIRAIGTVLDAAAQAANQKCFKTNHFPVQV